MITREQVLVAVYGGGDDAVAAVTEYLNQRDEMVDSITKAFTTQRWIPVSERLPDHGEDVLTYVDQATVPLVRGAYYDDGRDAENSPGFTADELRGWWFATSSVGQKKLEGIFEPTHWMPLPPLPEAIQ